MAPQTVPEAYQKFVKRMPWVLRWTHRGRVRYVRYHFEDAAHIECDERNDRAKRMGRPGLCGEVVHDPTGAEFPRDQG